MPNIVIEMPDDLARRLKTLADAQHKTVQQIAVERLRSALQPDSQSQPGSPAEVLRVVMQPPHPTIADVEELERAIAGARIPMQSEDLFTD